MQKFLLGVFFLILLIASPFWEVQAADKQFLTDHEITYQVLDNGEVQVSQNVTITNLKNDVIVSGYTFSLNRNEPYDITATSNGEKTEPQKSLKEDIVSLNVKINNYVIGTGRQNKINLSYKTKDIASKIGDIWNIYIPKTQITEATSSYNVKLSIPKTMGPKIFVSPIPSVEKGEPTVENYFFTKEQLIDKGISGAFGKYQVINFRLKYQLENTSIFPSIQEIAVPSDVQNVQQVKYLEVTPEPLDIKFDKDNNLIYMFKLGAKQKTEITVKGTARISGRQINPAFGGRFPNLPKDLVNEYTKSQKFWESDSLKIKEIANGLKDEKMNVTQNANKIYKYLLDNLEYDYDTLKELSVTRKGAETALSKKQKAICMEFTDSFIALARAMGIPAREIDGYAFAEDAKTKPITVNTKNGDFLHSWVEFYDPFYGWIQVDPTWGSTSGMDYFTKLDTNHFAFVTKGYDPEFPRPAGSYRFNETDKLVEVDFSQNIDDMDFGESLKANKYLGFNMLLIVQGKVPFKIYNDGNVTIYTSDHKQIAPGKSIVTYIDKNSGTFNYQDFNGTNKQIKVF